MAAAYDTYDYPDFWEGREYEHYAEVIALKHFLGKIVRIKKIVDVGAGYGRLTPNYLYRASKVILTDPSAKVLKIAREQFKLKKVRFIQSKAEGLLKKIKSKSVDLVVIVRVLHHVESIDTVFRVANRLLKRNGYLIIEFANKSHFKATVSQFMHGNLVFPLEIFPKDIRSPQSVKDNTLPFVNYHPDMVFEKLKLNGFKIVEVRSVSNIRIPFLKKVLPLDLLLLIEGFLQRPFARFNLGPSIFILAKKVS